jgi:hypothetical protein
MRRTESASIQGRSLEVLLVIKSEFECDSTSLFRRRAVKRAGSDSAVWFCLDQIKPRPFSSCIPRKDFEHVVSALH